MFDFVYFILRIYRKPINRLFYKKGQNPLVIITKAQLPTADA